MKLEDLKPGMIFKDHEVTIEVIECSEKIKMLLLNSPDKQRRDNDFFEVTRNQTVDILLSSESFINNVTYIGLKEDHPEYYL